MIPSFTEVSSKAEYSIHSDVFAFAILMWEIVSISCQPFGGLDGWAVAAAIQQGQRPEIPDDCPPQLRNLIKKCWDSEPKQRPTMQQAIEDLKKLIPEQNQVNIESFGSESIKYHSNLN